MPLRVSAEALFCLQQIVQKVHALYLLLEIGAPIDIQREWNILVSKDFRERFDVKLRYLDCSHCEGVPDLMELYLLQPITLEKAGEKLPVWQKVIADRSEHIANSVKMLQKDLNAI